MFRRLVQFSIEKPKWIIGIVLILVFISLFQFTNIKVDTDPENMLSEKEFVRIFNNEIKKEFGLYDFIVLGIVNEENVNGVFNPETLEKIYNVTKQIKKIDGVIGYELISPSTKDDIEQSGIGAVSFNWLMGAGPYSEEKSLHLRDRAMENPMFYGTIISENGKATCIYVPIKTKNLSYKISKEIRAIVDSFPGNEKYYITGLPVANDTFGFEMFVQMAISAPLAMLVIFILMMLFFKKINLVLSPLFLAGITVIVTMGLLIGLGFTVHIMSSMIPIFLMPIAVLDSVHILSEFFEKYQKSQDRKKAITETIDDLFMPMLFTSLTTTAGFLSLAFAKIPPVQVFGVFVAVGVMVAWILTITFIPASISLMNQKSFKNFGTSENNAESGIMNKILMNIGKFSIRRWKAVILGTLVLICISGYGITKIVINDNPIKWFTKNHEIRIADKVLNEHFGGTYTAYMVIESIDPTDEVFKEPEMLEYIDSLQKKLLEEKIVGKTTSLADVTKKIYYELLGGDKKNNVIPSSKAAVAECLISYQNSHKPDDLWHFVTPDYSKSIIWVQLTSGDNVDMTKVVNYIEEYIKKHPAPYRIKVDWAGLTYINVVWQNKMVNGMFGNFMGSFIIVLFMMIFLFRSPVRGLISMIPLTVTIIFIYSLLGYFGKNYDMPVAVLSALTLGLSIDFAIHFLQRAREIYAQNMDWDKTAIEMFKEPARAIFRNALIISIGFLPLLLAPLVPYRTVGVFMFLIMLTSSVGTLIILPAIMTGLRKVVFEEIEKPIACKCSNCIILGLVMSVTVVYILSIYTEAGWSVISIVSILIIAGMSGVCNIVSKHRFCISLDAKKEEI